MDVPEGFIPAREALKYLKVSHPTLRKWSDTGQIETFRAPGSNKSRRFYNVRSFLEGQGAIPKIEKAPEKQRLSYCYCRVSTNGQRDDLKRQVEFMQETYPDHTIIKDIGSGLNFKRKGLKFLIDEAIEGRIEEIVVAYKDRLCRFGFELIEHIIQTHSKGEIVVLRQLKTSSQEELVSDLLAIIQVFSARVNGLRKYKRQISEDQGLTNSKTEEDI